MIINNFVRKILCLAKQFSYLTIHVKNMVKGIQLPSSTEHNIQKVFTYMYILYLFA